MEAEFDDGGPAFPGSTPGQRGMSLRAWLTGQALATSGPLRDFDIEQRIAVCIAHADEAIRQLNQPV